jgi:enoyl-CoA hydratase/carnithine racemase
VATIALNRSQTLNAWTLRMDKEVRHAMLAAEADPNVRVIVFTGTGRGFCSGADMGLLTALVSGGDVSEEDSITAGADGSELPAVREDYRQQYSYFPALSKPVIGGVNGAAAGLGFVLMLYCDVRLASDQVKLTTTFARRGLVAEYGLAWMLPRIVGMGRAMDLMLTGRTILADEALRIGLVDRVFAADEFAAGLQAYAKELASKCSPRSMKVIKRMAYEAPFQTLEEHLALATREMVDSFSCDDFREGVQHYLEKRDPNFTGT